MADGVSGISMTDDMQCVSGPFMISTAINNKEKSKKIIQENMGVAAEK